MTKRKAIAGGYVDSSDGPEEDIEPTPASDPSAKKAKSVPFLPPQLPVAAKPAPTSFQMLRSISAPARHLVAPLSTRQIASGITANVRFNGQNFLGSSGHTSHLELDVCTGNNSTADLAENSVPPQSAAVRPSLNTQKPNGRGTILLERQVNELAESLEEYKSTSDEQHRRTDEKLNRLLGLVDRLSSADDRVSDPALSRSASVAPSPVDTRSFLSNPLPTPEIIEAVSRVVTEARTRVGKKRSGPDDNSVKEHARTTFYRMLGIASARSIRPYFEDSHGEPDTLPTPFVDPETNYCRPYPHWRSSLTKNVAWVPTYILRFRSTIPNDRGELSATLRSLTDEQIVILLHDGPFRSCQAAWRDMRKTNSEIDAMRSDARRYRRTEKASSDFAYTQLYPTLQGPEWEYLSHPGYMSDDASDDEGTLVTMRPEHRAQWETNLFEAIHVAEASAARAQPGLSPTPRPNVRLVKRPIPHLERGTGSSKVTVRVAYCGISKSWRDKNAEELNKYAHFVNMNISTKPDISAFLAQHPVLNSDEIRQADGGYQVDQEQDLGGKDAGLSDRHESVEDVDEEEYSQVDDAGLDPLPDDYNSRIESGEYGGVGLLNKHNPGDDDFPIDPKLLGAHTHDDNGLFKGNSRMEPVPGTTRTSDTSPLESSASALCSVGNQTVRTHTSCPAPRSNSTMPPPPLLSRALEPTINHQLGKNRNGSSAGGTAGAQVNIAFDLANTSVPQPKKRGRPLGSKNKAKV